MDTKNTVSIPESITINGVTYVVKDTPELQQFIQTIAKVEKNKLYSQFETLKEQIAKLSNVQVVGGEKEIDIDSIVEKLKGTFVTKEDLSETLKGTVEEVVRPVLQATQRQQEDELQQYRQKLINENIATCIPELVQGKTKEELDASLRHSIEIRASYPTPSTVHIDPTKPVHDPLIQEQFNQLNGGGTPTPPPTTTAPTAAPMPPAAPRRPSPEAGEGGSDVKRMSMEEFAAQRKNLLQNLEATFGN